MLGLRSVTKYKAFSSITALYGQCHRSSPPRDDRSGKTLKDSDKQRMKMKRKDSGRREKGTRGNDKKRGVRRQMGFVMLI